MRLRRLRGRSIGRGGRGGRALTGAPRGNNGVVEIVQDGS